MSDWIREPGEQEDPTPVVSRRPAARFDAAATTPTGRRDDAEGPSTQLFSASRVLPSAAGSWMKSLAEERRFAGPFEGGSSDRPEGWLDWSHLRARSVATRIQAVRPPRTQNGVRLERSPARTQKAGRPA